MFIFPFRANGSCGTIHHCLISAFSICMKTDQQHREEIVRFGKMLHQTGLVAATDGNLSVRLENGDILCTPTLMSKGLIEVDDLVIVDRQGKKLSGSRGVSSEIAMHLLSYD